MFHKGKNETTQRAIHRLSFQAGIGKHSDSAVNKPCLFPSVLESDLHRSLAFEVLLKGNQLTPSLLPKHNQGEHQTCHILALISIELSLMFSQQREKKKKHVSKPQTYCFSCISLRWETRPGWTCRWSWSCVSQSRKWLCSQCGGLTCGLTPGPTSQSGGMWAGHLLPV